MQSLLEQDPDLARSLERLSLTNAELIELTTPRRDEIFRSATPEIEQLSSAETQLAEAERRRMVTVRVTHGARKFRNRWLVIAGTVCCLSPGVIGSWPGAALLSIGMILLTIAAVRWQSERRARRMFDDQEGAGVGLLRNSVQAARAALWTALVDRGLRPIVLQIRSQRVSPSYTTRLQYVSSRGLSEIFDPTLLEVETPAVRRVRDFLDSTPGGSIGLAGPRGTGKSTLMSSFVDGRSRRTDNKRGHAIQVSAPVEYDPRDFILYVFATLCQSVLVALPRWAAADPAEAWDRWRYFDRRGQFAALTLSVVSVVGGIGLLLPTLGVAEVDWQRWGGVALVAVGILVFGTTVAGRIIAARRSRSREAANRRLIQPREGISPETASLASRYLDLIRYQQTYTSGWSGSVKVGVRGLEIEGGATGDITRARNTLSLPEIVSMFKEFVTALTEAGPVIIGIDELDKIDTAEGAQAFLNDIKSLFGVHQCYFLISISEDALSSFERRGLPLRDAFDSALDDVVRVSPLDYPTALKLIRQRVIGLSSPYSALVYCLGAGLPRDIIRWTRALVLARGSVGDGLADLARHIVGEDLGRKVFASMLALSRQSSPADAGALEVLGGLVPVADAEWLLDGFARRRTTASVADGSQAAVVDELFAYFYFCATVLEVFTDELGEEEFGRFTGVRGAPGGVDQLVYARQCFSISPALGVSQVTAFRRQWGLDWPTSSVGSADPDRPEVGKNAA